MNDVVRIAFPGDESALKKLWRECFHADEGEINDFFSLLYRGENTVVGTAESQVVSMANLLYPGHFVAGSTVPCTMIYAVGTLPSARGRSLASKEVCAAVFQGFGMGAPVSVLSPAEESLHGFYHDKAGFSDFFYQAVFSCKKGDVAPVQAKCRTLTPHQYGQVRERLLAGRAHIQYSKDFLSYADTRFQRSGGGLFSFEMDGHEVCFAAAKTENTMVFQELLTFPGTEEAAIRAAASLFDVEKYEFRTPVDASHCFGTLQCSGMAVSDGSVSLQRDLTALGWYGITLE